MAKKMYGDGTEKSSAYGDSGYYPSGKQDNPYNYKGGERKDAQRSPSPSVNMYVGDKKSGMVNPAADKYHG